MSHPDADFRGSPPQNDPREADEERARLRPKMGPLLGPVSEDAEHALHA